MSGDTAEKVDGRTARSIATRKGLLDAAIEILMEEGYAGATTAKISERAGVSPGLFARYWPSKTDLIADAAAVAQRRGFKRMGERFLAVGGAGADGRVAAVRQMFEAFNETEMRLLGEIQVASRTDEDLRDALANALEDSVGFVVAGARALAPARELTDDFDDRLLALVDMARGLALRTASMSPRAARRAQDSAMAVATDLFRLDR